MKDEYQLEREYEIAASDGGITPQQRYDWLMDQPIKRFNIFGLRLMIDLHGYLDMAQLPPGLLDTLDRLYEGMNHE